MMKRSYCHHREADYFSITACPEEVLTYVKVVINKQPQWFLHLFLHLSVWSIHYIKQHYYQLLL